MGATWARNETVATARRMGMLVQKTDGSMAPRQTDFIALGYVKICGIDSPHYDLAVGTLTNQREPLLAPDPLPDGWGTIASVDDTANTMGMVGHGYELGDGPLVFTAGTPPGGLSLATLYWAVPTDANNFSLADSLANAYADSVVDLTNTTAGATLSLGTNPQRGIDGHFDYEATQAETDHAAPETIVIVNGPSGSGYERSGGGGAYSTAEMASAANDLWAEVLEGSNTAGDLLRLIVRSLVANFSKTGNDYVIRDLADSKDSHESTVTPTGKTGSNIIDAT